MIVDFYESPCHTCKNCIMTYKGCPATREEPAEDPEFECEEDSDNFCTKDGCWSYAERDYDDGPDPDAAYDRWREERWNSQ